MGITRRGAACLAALIMTIGPVAATPTAASASPLPKLFVTIRINGTGIFKVRPRYVVVDSADGGELDIHWQRYTATSASGTGWAHPDHGSYRIKVTASQPEGGGYTPRVFTRLTVIGKSTTTWHRDAMGLGYVGGVLSWIRLSSFRDPGSGAVPWSP